MMKDQSRKGPQEDYRHADPVTDQALEWFVRVRGGAPVERDDKALFEAWLAESPAHRAAWDEIAGLWDDPAVVLASSEIARREEEATVVAFRPRRRVPSLRTALTALAATLVLTLSALQFAGPLMVRLKADYRTETGEMREARLPDGSRMILNTHSAVALDFTEGRRGVRLLEGEAWFDVAHDAAHPFHVAGAFSTVEVKGTVFTVRRSAGGDVIALQEGAVEAAHENPAVAAVRLKPGETVSASPTALSSVSHFDDEETFGWLEGRIVFSGKPLGAALEEIGAYLDGRIVVLNRALLDVAVSGNYRTDSAGAAVAGVVAAAGGSVTRLPGGLLIIR